MEAVESYCNEYNAKHADVTKEAGLVLVETVNLLMGLQAADVHRYSLEPFVVTRNGLGAEPSVAVVQLADTGFEVSAAPLLYVCTCRPNVTRVRRRTRRTTRCATSCSRCSDCWRPPGR